MKKIKQLKDDAGHAGQNLVNEAALSYVTAKGPGSASDMDLLRVIKGGISKKTLDKTMKMMDFTLDDMSGVLHVSERTLRRYDDDTVLSTEQSERVVELNSLYNYGVEVLGSLDTFKEWINSNILALGNKKPKEFLDTSLGINILKKILGRIEYGVYS